MSTIDPPDEENSDRRRRDQVALLGAIVVLIAAIITAITTGGIPVVWHKFIDPPPPPPPVPAATIASPADVLVPHVLQLFGTYDNLPPNTVIYAVSQDMTTNTLFPQDKACSIDNLGGFNCGTYYVGSDTGHGEKIKILIVAATADAVNGFSRYEIGKGGPKAANPGMDALPVGSTVIGFKDVVHA